MKLVGIVDDVDDFDFVFLAHRQRCIYMYLQFLYYRFLQISDYLQIVGCPIKIISNTVNGTSHLPPLFLYINTAHFVVDVWLLMKFFMSEMCWLIEYHHKLVCLVVCHEALFDLWELGKLKATISTGCAKISANREGGNASPLLHCVYIVILKTTSWQFLVVELRWWNCV